MATLRTNRMMDALPPYYASSMVMEAIQAAQADEYDNQETRNLDLQAQLSIATATWGLTYWEYPLGIPVVNSDTYAIRRSRILAVWRGMSSQFSSVLIRRICEAFSGGAVTVSVTPATYQVKITFSGTAGIPPNMQDLKNTIDSIVHAHMEVLYEFIYSTWEGIEDAALIYNGMDTYVWNGLETAFAQTE